MSVRFPVGEQSPWPPAVPAPVRELLLDRLRTELDPATLDSALSETDATIAASYWARAFTAPLTDFLGRPSKMFRASITEWAWFAAGGDGDIPPQLLVAVEALHAGSLIVDDIEDDATERRDDVALHLRYGVPCSLNAGNWLYFWPGRLIGEVRMTADRELAALRKLGDTQHRCHLGQGLDVSLKIQDVVQDDVVHVAAAKSALKTGALLGFGSYLGAVAAGADPDDCETFATFGEALGNVLQTLDDAGSITGDTRAEKAREDLVNGAPTWVWAWAAERLDTADYDDLVDLAQRVQAGDVEYTVLQHRLRLVVPPDLDDALDRDLTRALDAVRPAVVLPACLTALQGLFERLRASYG